VKLSHTVIIAVIAVCIAAAGLYLFVGPPADAFRRAKTAKVAKQLDKIYERAERYFQRVKKDSDGEPLPHQFPASVSVTPAQGTCCAERGGVDDDGDGRCDKDEDAWKHDTWRALKFKIRDQHFFAFEFENNGKTGSEAVFTASAYADLDCDGQMSTFRRIGRGVCDDSGKCRVEGSETPEIIDELE